MKNEKQKPYLVFHKIEEFLNDNFGGIRIEDDVIGNLFSFVFFIFYIYKSN